MVNLVLYLSDENKARTLVTTLLQKKLIAHASIATSRETLSALDGKLNVNLECVITAQTKAVLFEEISRLVTENYGNEIRIFSIPIAQCNDSFSEVIRTETKDPG